jgi:hypothetical protein
LFKKTIKRFLSGSDEKIHGKIRNSFRKQKFFANVERLTPLLPDEIVENHPDALKLRTRGELLAW